MVENTGGVVRTDNREREPGQLNDKLAREINALAENFPDEVRIVDLRIPPSSLLPKYYIDYGYIEECSPPDGWTEYYSDLSTSVRAPLSVLLRRVIKAGFETIGSVREASIDELVEPRHIPNGSIKESPILNQKNAQFIKACFLHKID
jgi:hypothetical protein